MTTSLFAQALGRDFQRLPRALRDFHDGDLPKRYQGRADITCGRHPLARLALWLGGFPPEGTDVPVTVSVEAKADGEVWTRDFSGHVARSDLYPAADHAVDERFGPITLRLSLRPDAEGLGIHVEGARLFGVLPLPRLLCPISASRESVASDGAFQFDIAGSLPIGGEMIRYRGTLTPA